MLLDSNILIYAAKPEYAFLLDLWQTGTAYASAISRLEVLGYHRLAEEERAFFTRVFATLHVIQLDEPIVDRAIHLRQQRKLSMGDALIAATALQHGIPLVTRNADDFSWITGLEVVNPFAESDMAG